MKRIAKKSEVLASIEVRINLVESNVRVRLLETLEFIERKLAKSRGLTDKDIERLRTKLLSIVFYLPPDFKDKAQLFDKVLNNLKHDKSWLKNPNHQLLNDLLEEIQEIKKKHRKAVEELAECRRKLKECGCAS